MKWIIVENKNIYINNDSIYNKSLRETVIESLIKTGFTIGEDGKLIVPNDKEYYRKVNKTAIDFLRNKKSDLIFKDDLFIDKYMIDGINLNVRKIDPVLVEVDDKEKADLFNWIKLHWSVPISSGYGRRLRYIVKDGNNEAVIGIIGLGDPVFALHDRELYIGWSYNVKKEKLRHLMDAFVLGAVPPYSAILGGKLVAALISSPLLRERFCEKYNGSVSRISGKVFDGRLAGITTASALGKSSLYDRIRIPNGTEFLHVGWTKGSGEFQFINGVYDELYKIGKSAISWKKNPSWGSGIRNRRTIIQSALREIGLPVNLTYHNVKREIFFVPLGTNSRKFLRGEDENIDYYKLSHESISEFMLKRWVIPRSERDARYREFNKWDYGLASLLK